MDQITKTSICVKLIFDKIEMTYNLMLRMVKENESTDVSDEASSMWGIKYVPRWHFLQRFTTLSMEIGDRYWSNICSMRVIASQVLCRADASTMTFLFWRLPTSGSSCSPNQIFRSAGILLTPNPSRILNFAMSRIRSLSCSVATKIDCGIAGR